jgi:hypothetical protein
LKSFSSLDFASWPYVFSQRSPLSPNGFIDAARERGVELDNAQLEAFHRAGLLVPIYETHDGEPRWERSAGQGHQDLQDLMAADQVWEPAASGFRSWTALYRRTPYGREFRRVFSYSPYQLLGLREIVRFQHWLRPSPRPGGAKHHSVMVPRWWPSPMPAVSPALVGLLTRLEPVFLPRIIEKISTGVMPGARDTWLGNYRRFRESFDAAAVMRAFDLNAEELLKVADLEIFRADTLDPLRYWINLVRQITPDRWGELRGAALQAIDHRIAAEILYLFYEALAEAEVVQALPPIPRRVHTPQHDRLNKQPDQLDSTLSRFGLSPNPRLLIIAEGPSDEILIRGSLAALGWWHGRSFIDVTDSEGVKKRIDNLVSWAAAPELGEEHDDYVVLARPLTSILRVTDEERPMASAADREAYRKQLVLVIETRVNRGRARKIEFAEFDRLVRMMTWGSYPLEFANFTNVEITSAVNRLRKKGGRATAGDINRIRIGPNPGATLDNFLTNRRIGKPELARDLLPRLEDRLKRLDQKAAVEKSPMGAVIISAVETALNLPRSASFALKLRPLKA